MAADASDSGSAGLLDPQQIDDLVEAVHANSRGESRLATGTAASNVDLYQVNCTYYDALGQDDTAYLIARMIQFFTPACRRSTTSACSEARTTCSCSKPRPWDATSTATGI
ncbi:MAG: hypothetical protein ACR2MA_00295 [Egibacteraceae bacterium]